MKKKLFIPLIFLFSFFIGISIIPASFGATTTKVISVNKILQPVEGSWFYEERNGFIDFEIYLEGSAPNLTTNGTLDETDLTGIYKYQSSLFTDLNPPYLPSPTSFNNFSYEVPAYNTSNYNITGATWENITINSNISINLNDTGNYAGNQTFFDDTVGNDPIGWTVWEPGGTDVYVQEEYLNHKKIVRLEDWTNPGVARIQKEAFNEDINGTLEFWINWGITETYDTITISEGTSYTTNCIYFYSPLTTQWGFYNGSNQLFYHGNGTVLTRAIDTWYRFKIDFNTSSHWNYYLAKNDGNYNLLYDSNNFSSFSYTGTPNNLTYVNFVTVPTMGGKFWIDSVDFSNDTTYYDNRINDWRDYNGYYESDAIDFGEVIEIDGIDCIGSFFDSSITVNVSDNSTGAFDNWVDYSIYSNSTRFMKYRVFFNRSRININSIFNYLNFNIQEMVEFSPFLNGDDKMLLLYPIKNTSQTPAGFFYDFNMSNSGGFTRGEIEFVSVHAFYPNLTINASGSTIFTVLINENKQFCYRVQTYYNNVTLNGWGIWEVWNGVDYEVIDTVNYRFHDNDTNDIEDYFFLMYDVIIDYTHNTRVSLTVSELDSFNSATQLFENTTSMVATDSKSTIDHSNFYFGTNATQGTAMLMCGIDSSRMRIDYQRNEIFDIVTKNFTAYNIETTYSYQIYTDNEMLTPMVSKIEIMSEINATNFISFIVETKGNTYDTQTFTNINDFTTVSPNIYNPYTLYSIIINAKYRCKNLNEFNNTIYLRVTWIYTPWNPGIMDLMLQIIPPTLILIIPSGVAYTKFNKTGFLAVFFLMTLILMGTGMIPLVPGLLMISLLVVIFLKLMQQQKGEN